MTVRSTKNVHWLDQMTTPIRRSVSPESIAWSIGGTSISNVSTPTPTVSLAKPYVHAEFRQVVEDRATSPRAKSIRNARHFDLQSIGYVSFPPFEDTSRDSNIPLDDSQASSGAADHLHHTVTPSQASIQHIASGQALSNIDVEDPMQEGDVVCKEENLPPPHSGISQSVQNDTLESIKALKATSAERKLESPEDSTKIGPLGSIWQYLTQASTSPPPLSPPVLRRPRVPNHEHIFQFFLAKHTSELDQDAQSNGTISEERREMLWRVWDAMGLEERQAWSNEYRGRHRVCCSTTDEQALREVICRQKRRGGPNLVEIGGEWDLADEDWFTGWQRSGR